MSESKPLKGKQKQNKTIFNLSAYELKMKREIAWFVNKYINSDSEHLNLFVGQVSPYAFQKIKQALVKKGMIYQRGIGWTWRKEKGLK